MKNPVAYILVGVPAAGKSTWYENFKDDTPTVYASTDDFVERYAKEQGKTLAAHYAHLLVHGCLHAQGWDHETSLKDAHAMEAREADILAGLGFPNPYR